MEQHTVAALHASAKKTFDAAENDHDCQVGLPVLKK